MTTTRSFVDSASGPTPDADANALVDLADRFMRKRVAPLVAEYDRNEKLPVEVLREMGALGFFGGVLPTELGGLGLDYRTFARLVETVSQTCQIMGTLVSMPSGLVGASIQQYGTAEQKEQWLAPLARGEIFGAAGVTEPASGSDVAGMHTTYRREGDTFVINGSKAWISNLDIADFVVTFATRDRSLRHQGITAFVIPRDTPGLGFHPYKDKMGFRPLCTGEVVLDNVRLGAEALLGEEGSGFRVAMAAVERGRLGVASRAVGLAQAAMDDTIAYAKERIAFGRPIADFQLVQSKITDMAVGVRTARTLVDQCADALDKGERARQLTSMAKMYASDVAMRTALDAAQVHGAYSVSPEYRIGRFFRDAKVLQIVEGSNDVHRALIGEIALGLRPDGESRR
jgi:alkylation response protein AidB-like acyl-CoA dehydrogenase